MRTIQVSEQNFAAIEDHLDPDIKTHDDVISGLFGFIEALIEQNAKLKARVAKLDTDNYRPWEAP